MKILTEFLRNRIDSESPRIDVWGFGLVLQEVITLEHAFGRQEGQPADDIRIVENMKFGKRTNFQIFGETEEFGEFETLIQKCLRPTRESRPNNMMIVKNEEIFSDFVQRIERGELPSDIMATSGEMIEKLRDENRQKDQQIQVLENIIKNQIRDFESLKKEFEEEKAAGHEDLINHVDEFTQELEIITTERNDLVAENKCIKERNETLDTKNKQMELDLAAKDEEIKQIRAEFLEGAVKRADHIKLKNDYNALIDELEKQEARVKKEMVSKAAFAAMERSKENYKNKLIEKNEEIELYHEEMEAHFSKIMNLQENQQKTYQEWLLTMKKKKEQKWILALENSKMPKKPEAASLAATVKPQK
ncbi:Oidioi.mRNA.OKI2018_I69.PAR.g10015.t1.cds [Oikopleura dioica]|uniref:Oidioi.mRNA.OKI2018_I69.PAR.g10015.t1.cds n=1 Tax=Oikopleura dioica TaxID=34765 RepID=A0ABN7RNH5_OIKDI|nr:Oidioi.mRNA.OKI2018_I69.PAR.g10015.t1.cds [Oikopleura dioica]